MAFLVREFVVNTDHSVDRALWNNIRIDLTIQSSHFSIKRRLEVIAAGDFINGQGPLRG